MGNYRELLLLPTIEERISYLQRHQRVADRTFGGDRYFNQAFYKSRGWKLIRNQIIIRDGGWDLAVEGYPVGDRGYIHHIEPITIDQLRHGDSTLFNPDNLVLCSHETHNAIHYGASVSPKTFVERRPGDTKLW